MTEITLEKNHALLAKLAEYVMTEIPQIRAQLGKLAGKEELDDLSMQLQVVRQETYEKLNTLIEGMDAQAKHVENLDIEKTAISKTLDVYNQRLGRLEVHNFGSRVRDKKEE
jgi:hypothetical protein